MPTPPDARGGAGEVRVDQLALQTHGLEDLRAAVGLDRRDAHLGDRLEQAFADRLDVVLGRSLEQLAQLLGPGCERRAVAGTRADASFHDQRVERLEQRRTG